MTNSHFKKEYRRRHLKDTSDKVLKQRITKAEKWLEDHWEDKKIRKEAWETAMAVYEAMVEEARSRKLYKQGEI